MSQPKLVWDQPSGFSRRYELRLGETKLAQLEFAKLLGTLAQANTAEGAYTFKRTGFLKSVVTARVATSDHEVAAYEPNLMASRGRLVLSTGEVFELKSVNFWSSEWALLAASGEELIRFHNKGMLKSGANVDIGPSLSNRTDAGLLLSFCWYILLLHMMDTAATTTAICCS